MFSPFFVCFVTLKLVSIKCTKVFLFKIFNEESPKKIGDMRKKIDFMKKFVQRCGYFDYQIFEILASSRGMGLFNYWTVFWLGKRINLHYRYN